MSNKQQNLSEQIELISSRVATNGVAELIKVSQEASDRILKERLQEVKNELTERPAVTPCRN